MSSKFISSFIINLSERGVTMADHTVFKDSNSEYIYYALQTLIQAKVGGWLGRLFLASSLSTYRVRLTSGFPNNLEQ